MREKKDLTLEDLHKLGVYEDTGQADLNDDAILRISFPTLIGKATVKNEILGHIKKRIDILNETQRAVKSAARKGYTIEIKKIAAKIEELAELYNTLSAHYNAIIDVEIRDRHREYFDGEIDSKNLIVVEGKTLH